jgi:sensor domain CHASE-containing protein
VWGIPFLSFNVVSHVYNIILLIFIYLFFVLYLIGQTIYHQMIQIISKNLVAEVVEGIHHGLI